MTETNNNNFQLNGISSIYKNPLDIDLAKFLDLQDPLKDYRSKFLIPNQTDQQQLCKPAIYLCGNSLGLQPKSTRRYIEEELKKWEEYGVEAQLHHPSPWVPYDEICVEQMAEIVGAKSDEVVLMNSLTVNLHLMLHSFYSPTEQRYKILMEDGAFPSDNIAIGSHLKLRGLDPDNVIIRIMPRPGECNIRDDDIIDLLESQGHEIALILFGGVNYYTGQVLDMERITTKGKLIGCNVGFDLAHAVGNTMLQLHDWNVDFAVWCTYKYLNSGPGGIGGCYIHEKHSKDGHIPRLAGWWSHDKGTRFLMKPELKVERGALGFQISNPPILCLASLKASLEIFAQVGMEPLIQKSKLLVNYMETLLLLLSKESKCNLHILTPSDATKRGCQLSLIFKSTAKDILDKLKSNGIICDYREPDCIRVAPTPLYNTFMDVYIFVNVLIKILANEECGKEQLIANKF